MDPKRLLASLPIVVLAIVAASCSASSSATPTAEHRATIPTSGPSRSSTTTAPSATPTTVPVAVPHAPGWTLALTTLPPGGGFTSLSCISDTLLRGRRRGDHG